jgi:hypothetical protein
MSRINSLKRERVKETSHGMVGTGGDVGWCADGTDDVDWFYLVGACLVFPPGLHVCTTRHPVLMALSFCDDLVLFGVCAPLALSCLCPASVFPSLSH